ncbi:hypothetical protein Pfo_005728 [Paulownia fortunei]|nr:hypothetical protein Pfo_005728 [Paulownia fortunei]
MAYASVISLKQTIQRLLNSSHISILPQSLKILEFAYKELQSLQEVLKRLDSSSSSQRANDLDGQIREAVCKLEVVLESHVSNKLLSQSDESLGDEGCSLILSLDLEKVRQEINSFTETVKKIKEEYSKEEPLAEEDNAVSSTIDFGGNKSKMVGLSRELRRIKRLFTGQWSSELEMFSLFGMAGIGKTTLAKEMFEDPLILSDFDCRVFVTIGPKCQLKKILQSILAHVNPQIDKMLIAEGDEKLVQYLYESLYGKRYLIVLDDVWNKEVWDDFKWSLPRDGNGSRVLVTTRLKQVAHSDGFSAAYQMLFLNKEESWCLLREKVFAEESCPPQLEKAGKKIAENCEGLPLTIIMVAGFLSKAKKTPEYWNKVAEKENSVFMDAYDEMSKVLFPSYKYLPEHLKACFLYMGVFPQNYEIPLSKLVKLWSAEGFLEPDSPETLEIFAMECLEDLVSSSLVMARKESSICNTKTCGLHSAFWHLCNREAAKNKFFHVLNSRADGLAEGIKNQGRLCIHNNILFGIKDVYNSLASISTARSLLCFGPHHQYPVPIYFGLRLLRVLDVLTILFYEFPMEVLKLVYLRYLAVTYNGNLPPSISKLWNLECLIVRRHLSIKSSKDLSYLPMEIWDMKELKHLQIMGSDLPDPCGALLPNLLTLLDVSAHSCTKEVLEKIPNLMKLGVRIELAPNAAEPLSCFDHISHLHGLNSLKCVIVNPQLRPQVVAPPAPLSIFPSFLRKLTMSGFAYPWEDMSKIASLPNLIVLKLLCNAFRGPKWETHDEGFLRLEFLLIEDIDMVHWRGGGRSFRGLQRLSIKHCYKLEEIPREFGKSLRSLEVVDCNPLAVTCAKQIEEDNWNNGRHFLLDVNVHSSWEDGNLKS